MAETDPVTLPVRALAVRALGLAVGLVVLHVCGRGPLARPSLDAGSWRSTAPGQPVIDTAMAVLRLAALGAGGYLLLVVAIALTGRGLRHRPTFRLATVLAPPSLRAVLAMATTAGVAASLGTGSAEATGVPAPVLRWTGAVPRPPGSASPPTLRWVGPALPATITDSGPVLRRVGPPTTTGPAPTVARRSGPVAAPGPPPGSRPGGGVPRRGVLRPVHRPGRARPGPDHWVVRPGDDFWSIAVARLRDAGAPHAPDEVVARYWQLLVQANAANLPVPGQPDLLFCGDRVDLPPLP